MSRRAGRELALKVLFQVDVAQQDPEQALGRMLAAERLDPEAARFAGDLVRGAVRHLSVIDDELSSVTPEWSLRQMASLDRNVLRLATYELLFADHAPDAVVINEAVELAKTYSTAESGRFVNGVLSRLLRRLTGQAPADR